MESCSDSETESDTDLEELYESFYSLDNSFAAEDEHSSAPPPTADLSPPLYDGATISKLQAILLVFQFTLRHGLSGKTFTELLQVLSVLLPQGNLLPRSVYLFKKSLIQLFPEAQDVKIEEA